MSEYLKTATAAQVADLLEHGGVAIDEVTALCARAIELLRQLAAAPVAAQEPIAYVVDSDGTESVINHPLPVGMGVYAQPTPAPGECQPTYACWRRASEVATRCAGCTCPELLR